jgi:hypothetical protein
VQELGARVRDLLDYLCGGFVQQPVLAFGEHFGCGHYHWQLSVPGVLLELPQEFKAVHLRHHQVEHD